MDPFTHLLIGAGVAGMAGNNLSLTNPLQLGALIGSVTPDFDIILQLKGDMLYLKHHRGFSHSIPGITLFSLLTAIVLKMFFPSYSIITVFIWTLLGNLSHIGMDVLNSYGAQVLWPLNKKKYTFNLLMIFDPILVLLFIGIPFIGKGDTRVLSTISFTLTFLYLFFRWFLRRRVEIYLVHKFRRREVRNITVMPAMYSIFGWDFVVELSQEYLVGHVRSFTGKTGLRCRLAKEKSNRLVETAMDSRIGKLFRDFTPYFHVSHWREGDKHLIRFTDLRYFINKDFMHSATLILDNKMEIIEGIFHPYNKKRNIKVNV